MFRVRTAVLFVLAALILGGVFLLRDSGIAGLPLHAPAPDFRLEAPYRGSVSLADFSGDAVLLTFARPSCDDCDPQLATLAEALARLGDRRSEVRVLVLSLEPLDDPSLLAFVQDHDLGFTALSGDSTAVRTVQSAYRTAEAEVDESALTDSVATAPLAPAPDDPRIYGIDRAGTLRAVWRPGDAATLARDIRTLLRYR